MRYPFCSHFPWEVSSAPMFAQEPGQRTFTSTENASRALLRQCVAERTSSLERSLDQPQRMSFRSGDPQEDLDARTGFVVKYRKCIGSSQEPERNST